jgi:ribosomal protein L44E
MLAVLGIFILIPNCKLIADMDSEYLRRTLPKSSVLLSVFCGQKDSMQRIFIKNCFLFTVESVCRVKQLSREILSRTSKNRRRRPTGCGSEPDIYAAGFDALVKRWDKFINVSGGYVEK